MRSRRSAAESTGRGAPEAALALSWLAVDGRDARKTRRRKNSKRLPYDGSRSCMLELLMMLSGKCDKRGGARSSDLYEGTRV